MKAILAGLLSHLGACFVTSWKSTVVGLLLAIGAEGLNYLGTVPLPPWAHALVGIASAALVFYKGQPQAQALPAQVQVPASGAEAAAVATRP